MTGMSIWSGLLGLTLGDGGGRWSEIARGLQNYFEEQGQLAASAGYVLLGLAFIIINVLVAKKLIGVLTRESKPIEKKPRQDRRI